MRLWGLSRHARDRGDTTEELRIGVRRQVFGTLANKNCLRILAALGKGACTVTEIVTHTRLSQSCVSHCLARLVRDGLVMTRREGRVRVCTSNAATIEQLLTLLDQHTRRREQ